MANSVGIPRPSNRQITGLRTKDVTRENGIMKGILVVSLGSNGNDNGAVTRTLTVTGGIVDFGTVNTAGSTERTVSFTLINNSAVIVTTVNIEEIEISNSSLPLEAVPEVEDTMTTAAAPVHGETGGVEEIAGETHHASTVTGGTTQVVTMAGVIMPAPESKIEIIEEIVNNNISEEETPAIDKSVKSNPITGDKMILFFPLFALAGIGATAAIIIVKKRLAYK